MGGQGAGDDGDDGVGEADVKTKLLRSVIEGFKEFKVTVPAKLECVVYQHEAQPIRCQSHPLIAIVRGLDRSKEGGL